MLIEMIWILEDPLEWRNGALLERCWISQVGNTLYEVHFEDRFASLVIPREEFTEMEITELAWSFTSGSQLTMYVRESTCRRL